LLNSIALLARGLEESKWVTTLILRGAQRAQAYRADTIEGLAKFGNGGGKNTTKST
jgi:hypothetical protein